MSEKDPEAEKIARNRAAGAEVIANACAALKRNDRTATLPAELVALLDKPIPKWPEGSKGAADRRRLESYLADMIAAHRAEVLRVRRLFLAKCVESKRDRTNPLHQRHAMAHHSSEPSDALRALFNQAPKDDLATIVARVQADEKAKIEAQQFGATGKFPLGKLTPEDEGEIRIGITHTNPEGGALGKVIIDFGKATTWIGFTAEQAHEIARTLLEHAAKCYPNPAGSNVVDA